MADAHLLAAQTPASLAYVTTQGRWLPFEHLLRIDEQLVKVARREITRLIVQAPIRHGKALALDTPIATPTGWATIGSLNTGDQVFDEQGQPCRVVAKSPVWTDRDCYIVRTDDGDEIVADAEHEWRVCLDARDAQHEHTTRRLAGRAGQAAIVQLTKSLHGMRAHRRYLTFEMTERCATQCIQVDSPSRLFLAGRSMTPTHNSELISRYFPAWYLGRFPDHQMMLASYEATLARSWGRKARDVLAEHGRQIFGVTVANMPAAADWWTVDNRDGVMVTAGVGGSLTGKGADILVIDDPVKNAEEAQSQVYRDKAWDWWQSTARSRLQPNGAVVVVMARWHEDDLVGRLLAQADDEWTVLTLPAIAENDDPMGRQPGEALCREMFDEQALERTKQELGAYWFSALLQQRPAPAEGLLFKREHFRTWREAAVGNATVYILDDGLETRHIDRGYCTRFQTADIAASDKTTADFTVVATWAVTPQKDLLLLDVERQHFETLEVPGFLKRCSDKHGQPPMWIEAFGAGMVPLRMMRRDGYPVMELTPEQGTRTDKISRAFAAVAAYERHAVFHPQAERWLDGFEQELLSFPNAKNDDQVDVVSYAARLLPRLSAGRKAPQDVTRHRPVLAGVMGQRF